jgi:outer membrane protein OmpA-like peptidoglycan-associated protein
VILGNQTGGPLLRSTISRLALAACIAGAAAGQSTALSAIQQSGEVQTAPITEPRGAQREDTNPAVAKGASAIIEQDTKCSRRFFVNADALFDPGRWTLNPDAAKTLDPLVPMVEEAGNHPLRIESYARSSDSEKNNQILAEKRALTVRGWLSNRGYIPPSTVVRGFGSAAPGVSPSTDSRHDPKKEQIQLIFDTCQ